MRTARAPTRAREADGWYVDQGHSPTITLVDAEWMVGGNPVFLPRAWLLTLTSG